jgi:hypothetical protein
LLNPRPTAGVYTGRVMPQHPALCSECMPLHTLSQNGPEFRTSPPRCLPYPGGARLLEGVLGGSHITPAAWVCTICTTSDSRPHPGHGSGISPRGGLSQRRQRSGWSSAMAATACGFGVCSSPMSISPDASARTTAFDMCGPKRPGSGASAPIRNHPARLSERISGEPASCSTLWHSAGSCIK